MYRSCRFVADATTATTTGTQIAKTQNRQRRHTAHASVIGL